jgi:NADH:ubiquinone oxidoreductase subunit K
VIGGTSPMNAVHGLSTSERARFVYIAVLGFGVWSLAIGLANLRDADVEQVLDGRLARRTTAGFMLVVASLFALTWLGQMWSVLLSGQLPAELTDAGWPMNPVWVLDLGFVLPLMALTAIGLLTRRPQAPRLAVPLLVFMALLGVTILAMAFSAALDGQPLAVPMVAIFVVVVAASSALAAVALLPRRQSRQELQHAHVP